jgi:hypothetical protein
MTRKMQKLTLYGEKKPMSPLKKKLLAGCIGAIFAQCSVTVAYAQSAFTNSAVGVDTALGNALNPPGRSNLPNVFSDDGYDTVRRTPTGQLYGIPIDRADEGENKAENGWLYSGTIDIGVLGGSANAKYSKYNEYKDLQKGFGLNYFSFMGEDPKAGYFINGYGGAVGNKDQFYDMQAGHYNDWKIKAFYTEIPHVFSDTFKPLYVYSGGNHEYLNPAYGTATAGANATAWMNNPVTQSLAADQEVSLVRKRMGLRGDWTALHSLKFYATATNEKREGARPYAFMGMEGVEPIKYNTSDFAAGMQYFDGKAAANLRTTLSVFQNDIKQLYVDNPIVARGAGYPVAGIANIYSYIYTLPPDNKAASIKGDGSYQFDWQNLKLTGGVSWGTSRNNDSLRMPLDPNFLTNGTAMAAGGTAADWNGTNGCPMSRCDSDLRVDSTLYNLGFSLDPTDNLTVRGNARQYENKNKSPIYYSANPLLMGTPNSTLFGVPFSGFFNTAAAFSAPVNALGAGGNGGTALGTFTNTGPSYFSPPRSDKTNNYTLSGEYTFARTQAVDLSWERENLHQTWRERDNTHEDKYKLTYVGRNFFDSVTVRTSIEHDQKRGGFYDPLVTTRPLASFMMLNGLPYSRAALQSMIATAMVNPAAINVLPGGGKYTFADVKTAILGNNGTGGQGNTGGFMKIDEADRDQNIFNGRLGYSPTENIDLGLSLQIRKTEYPNNNFGALKDDQNSINLDTTYQPSTDTQISAYYSRQYGKQVNIENYGLDPNTGAAYLAANMNTKLIGMCGDLNTGNIDCWLNNALNPAANVKVQTKSTTDVFGLSLAQSFGWARVGFNYVYMRGNTSIVHQYSMNGGTALTVVQQGILAQYGDWPSMQTTMQTFEFNVVKDLTKRLTTRLMYRFETLHNKDWHYDNSLLFNQTNFAAADYGPQNYRVNILGFFLMYKL